MCRFALLIALVVVALCVAILLFPSREAKGIIARFEQPSPKPAVVLFGGDMMFDRSIREYAKENGGDYLFSCLDQTLQGADLVVANLEGPITDLPSVSVGSTVGSPNNYAFTFPTSTASLLASHHIGAVTLANNHIFNQGAAGVRQTTGYLSDAHVTYFGDPLAFSVANLDIRGVPLSLIGYNEFIPEGGTASSTLADIQAAKAAGGVPIVFAHWGDEYAPQAPERVISLAHAFVDAGAAAVIGSHPHVVEQSEYYHGAPIFYSLGNLIFDQYWDQSVSHGLMVELAITGASAEVAKMIPVELGRDRRVCPVQR